jgi:hypothetical protein
METQPAETIYHIARDGNVVANYDFKTLYAKFKEGAVKPTDHYIIEGTADWQLVETLKSKFAAFEQEEKAKKKRLKEEAEQKAISDQAESARKHHEEWLESKKKDYVPWKCWTCATTFRSNGKAVALPGVEGINTAVGYVFLAGILTAFAVGILFSKEEGAIIGFFIFIIGAVVALAVSLGQIISYGVESGLQKFHSYRPRCPQCSSPYCSKLEDNQPTTTPGA